MYLFLISLVFLDPVTCLPSDVHIHLYMDLGGEHVGIAPGVMTDHYNNHSGISDPSLFDFNHQLYNYQLVI